MSAKERCAECGGKDGWHGMVHVRHGNGGGHNEICSRHRLAHCIHGPGCDQKSHGIDCNNAFYGVQR